MAFKISVINQKGGVAKTTTTASIGSILANKGYKVVMVDLDYQSDLTMSCPIDQSMHDIKKDNIFECLFTHNKVVGININPRLVLIAGSQNMEAVKFTNKISEHDEYSLMNHRKVMRKFFQRIENSCDFILFDCPPSKDIIVQNALMASDYVLIPTTAHSFSINGVNGVLEMVDKYRSVHENLRTLGILFSCFDSRNKIDKTMLGLCREEYGALLFETVIRTNTKLKENTHMGIEIIEYAKELEMEKIPKKFSGYDDFSDLANEIISRVKIKETA